MTETHNLEYKYGSAKLNCSHTYLLPAVKRIVADLKPSKIFDLGCGNGSTANELSGMAIVDGVDVSNSAIAYANKAYPNLRLEVRSVYDDLVLDYGTYPLVMSLEVVEHLYDPRAYAKNMFNLVAPSGYAVVSTPYHGYFKNVAMSVSGTLDRHFTALWDGGHIKFWSIETLGQLLSEAGFVKIKFERVGRISVLAKSMIAIAQRPAYKPMT
jgi:2-polyprenyl-3-methyl-5-hydroxy-6-metoxy-1,4-benzoquinol methylase